MKRDGRTVFFSFTRKPSVLSPTNSARELHRTPEADRAESREASKQRAEPSTSVNLRGTAEVSGPRSRFILIKIQPRCFCWYLPEAIRCQQSFLRLKAVLNLAIPTPDSYHLSISSHHGLSFYSWTPQGERFSQVDRLLLPYSWAHLCLPPHILNTTSKVRNPITIFEALPFYFLLSSEPALHHSPVSAKSSRSFLRQSPEKITLGKHPLISTSSKPPHKRRVSTACSKHAMYGWQLTINTQSGIHRCGKSTQVLHWSWQPPCKRPVLITY